MMIKDRISEKITFSSKKSVMVAHTFASLAGQIQSRRAVVLSHSVPFHFTRKCMFQSLLCVADLLHPRSSSARSGAARAGCFLQPSAGHSVRLW